MHIFLKNKNILEISSYLKIYANSIIHPTLINTYDTCNDVLLKLTSVYLAAARCFTC